MRMSIEASCANDGEYTENIELSLVQTFTLRN